MRRSLACFGAAALLALVGSACSSTLTDAATIKYSLSGTDHEDHVTRSDLIDEVRKIAADEPFAKWLNGNGYHINGDLTTGSAVASAWLTQLIQQKAIDALYASRDLHVTAAEQAQAASTMPQLFPTADIFPAFDAKFRATLTDREARREALYASYVDTSDAAGEKYYRAHASEFACASRKNVAHILVASRSAAQQIVDQLRAGASFSKLAQQDSIDTQSGAQGGMLGCLVPGGFVAPFQKAADAAPFDTPVGPVRSKFGYHVIVVTHATASYAAVRNRVLQALAQQGQVDVQSALDNTLKSFKVHVDPRFGTWGLVPTGQGGQRYQVSPPKVPNPSNAREGTTTTTTTAALPGAAGTP